MTFESISDKLCDQVSDAVLDACIREDPVSRVACETCTKTGMVMIFGEITTSANVNYEQVIRDALRDIGYDAVEKGDTKIITLHTTPLLITADENTP